MEETAGQPEEEKVFVATGDEVTDTLARVLDVENPAETIGQTQNVLAVEFDTDLEAAAKFDLLAYIEKYDLSQILS